MWCAVRQVTWRCRSARQTSWALLLPTAAVGDGSSTHQQVVSSILQQQQRQQQHPPPPPPHYSHHHHQYSFYTSRAHPQPIPEYSAVDAIRMVLEGIQARKEKRLLKWQRNAEARRTKRGREDDPGGYRNQDETIELALNLNLDPRRPGEALRGSLALPHGSGRRLDCVVFTTDKALQQEALENGALHAGGEELVERMQSGEEEVSVEAMDRCLATPDMSAVLGRTLARLLGPRGLMPNAKVGTLVPPEELITALRQQQAGQVQYRTDKTGIVHMPVGKGSFGPDRLMDNLRAALQEIHDVKPENFGKDKKSGGAKKKKGTSKNAKYLLRAHLSSTQGEGVRMDLRTVDPTSVFFMSKLPE